MKRRFYIVDVFAEEQYAGNQLAVIRDSEGLSDQEMQRIAKEMNYSETTFILSESEREGGYDVRIFTPASEVPFAGHPTLGTAFVIAREIKGSIIERVVLHLRVGPIPVTFDASGTLWMKQRAPEFGETYSHETVARALGLEERDMDTRFPPQMVSTGLPFVIVPLTTMDAMKRSGGKGRSYFDWLKDVDAKALLAFSSETYGDGNDLNARVYADDFGVPEDPATGSANGCLAAYLARHRYFGGTKVNARVEQGYEIGRPSLLFLRSEDRGEDVEVHVGGHVIPVARGDLD
jgi:trans-2,3-dihydro-3-hydroxyanthranilate isomerase